MPFHSTPRLDVGILFEAGKVSFKKMSETDVVSYSLDQPSDSQDEQCAEPEAIYPVVQSAHRLPTGERLDHRVLRFSEVKDVGATEAVECLKDVRFYRIVLDGAEYAQHLEKKDQAAIDLYRSIVSKSRVRCSVRFNGGQPAVPLEVDLSYQLLAHDDGCDD